MATWEALLAAEKQHAYFQHIITYVAAQRAAGKCIFPAQADVFNAFKVTEINKVKVVILGQDPYHGPKQAHGLSFSVLPGVKPPPSLANIYKELLNDVTGFALPSHGYLQSWAEQGVLLLNTVLTVEQGKAHSHSKIGWERFTDKVIELLNEHTCGTVFLLWGSHAQKKGAAIDANKHHVLHAPHPSPLSAYRGFFGCKHFSQTNQLLLEQGKSAINWQV
ncbi:MAG: uracil-DNA glycosylase [Paraglaciecola sp.]|uniref:uracil-DNA glycosylase n=1 Tax=Pseudomonadati TaxID=3379134 RepID=UPI00273EA539|nr:uracil-DNA glycosylase [Paraglaciecola sp.]MDP5032996.1 uracil-DNA glycosylase [Paraglaciecola sp.]MDP5040840.1 uracil-DNA glycosylase [Paraglaciecola sp.]MDP5133635.1 uracil-DNA glycosylase [Paraglaciecola sp.]